MEVANDLDHEFQMDVNLTNFTPQDRFIRTLRPYDMYFKIRLFWHVYRICCRFPDVDNMLCVFKFSLDPETVIVLDDDFFQMVLICSNADGGERTQEQKMIELEQFCSRRENPNLNRFFNLHYMFWCCSQCSQAKLFLDQFFNFTEFWYKYLSQIDETHSITMHFESCNCCMGEACPTVIVGIFNFRDFFVEDSLEKL